MANEWTFRNVFASKDSMACYTIHKRSNGALDAVYRYASSACANVCDMVDWTNVVTADSWNELVRKLERKHPGWEWVTE